MSPLPEMGPTKKLDRSINTANIQKFFKDAISDGEKWVWVIPFPDNKQREALYKDKSVNFEVPTEDYITGKTGAREFHKVFSTPEKGLFLELIFDEYSLSKGSADSLIKYAVRSEFHRLGEKANEGYVESLMNATDK